MTESAVAISLGILTAVFLLAFWLAPGGVLALRRRAGGELQVDLRPAYSADTLLRLLEAYGSEGRGMFRSMLLADMVFPAIYGATLFLLGDLLSSSFPHAATPAAAVRWGAIAAAAFDYAENVSLLHAVRHWSARPFASARLASTFTTLKMAAFAVTAASLAASRLMA